MIIIHREAIYACPWPRKTGAFVDDPNIRFAKR
jgi:hypothetical protein